MTSVLNTVSTGTLELAAGILIVASPTRNGALACMLRTLTMMRVAYGNVVPDRVLDDVPPGGLPGLLGKAITALPRAPLDAVEAEAIVEAASSGALILVPFACSSGYGAQSAVRSLMPRNRRRKADDALLGVAFEDSEERPGATPARHLLHVKGKEAVRMVVASGVLDDFDGTVVAHEDSRSSYWTHSREATEVLAWRLANPNAVPVERRINLKSPLTLRPYRPVDEDYA